MQVSFQQIKSLPGLTAHSAPQCCPLASSSETKPCYHPTNVQRMHVVSLPSLRQHYLVAMATSLNKLESKVHHHHHHPRVSERRKSRRTSGRCSVTVFSLWLWPVTRTAERPDKQLSLQSAPKTVDCRQRRDRRWQWVPDLRSGDRKRSVTYRFVQRTRDLQRWRRAGAQPSARVDVGNWMELTGQVLWRRTVQTTICKNGKTEVDPLRNAQPMEHVKHLIDMVKRLPKLVQYIVSN